MKNMEREKFEESLRNAFENGEVSPSGKVWTNIELDLEKARGGDLKKRLMFYQILAAASVVFAMAIGGIGYYNSTSPGQADRGNVAMQTPEDSDRANSETEAQAAQKEAAQDLSKQKVNDAGGHVNAASDSKGNNGASINDQENSTDKAAVDNGFQRGSQDDGQIFVARDDDSDHRDRPTKEANEFVAPREEFTGPLLAIDDRNLSPFYTPKQIELRLPAQDEVYPILAMLARLDQREREVQGEKKNQSKKNRANENLWTSIGFAAGSFSSVQSSVSGSASGMQKVMALTAPIVEEETKASGYSYSVGVNVGTKISERWVFQGGVNYLTHASRYMADNVVASNSNYQQQTFRAASSTEVLNFDAHDLNAKIVYTAPYNVNNSMRYLSIPLQAGYLVVNKTLGLQLNAGVATDLFLQNTVTADSDQLEKTSQPGGSDSPYRSVNLSGLLGTEVSYRFGEHYRISLNPGIRYPFNTIYKSELGLQSTPLTFDVGLRFRYIFH